MSACFQLRRGLRDRLRKGNSRGIGTPGKLRPEWEMDNFFCSHRCTSTVRLWYLIKPSSVQYRSREPAISSAIGSGTTPSLIHLCKVAR